LIESGPQGQGELKMTTTTQIEATVTGKKYDTEFYGILPGVSLPRGVDSIGPDYGNQVVWIGETAYYVVQCPASNDLYLTRQIFGQDYGYNTHRTRTAPESTSGVAAKYRGLPLRASHACCKFIVAR
jgi:hypothetical protein